MKAFTQVVKGVFAAVAICLALACGTMEDEALNPGEELIIAEQEQVLESVASSQESKAGRGQWQEVGDNPISAGISPIFGHPGTSLAFGKSGKPIVAWEDTSTGISQIYLKKFNGKDWVELGGSATGGGISNTPDRSMAPSLAVDSKGYPVVAWWEGYSTWDIYVKRWDGHAWVEMGGSATGEGISEGPELDKAPSLALDSNDHPCVAWENSYNGFAIFLKCWDGVEWKELGGSASGNGINSWKGQGTNYTAPSLALDKLDRPSVAWNQYNGTLQIYFARWNGSAWEGLGLSRSMGLTADLEVISWWGNGRPTLKLDQEDNPIVAWHFSSYERGISEIYLRRWDGGSWVELGGSSSGGGVSNTSTYSAYSSLALDKSGCPWVAWSENVDGQFDIYLKYWDGLSWQELGGSASQWGISNNPGNSYYPSLGLSKQRIPVVSWMDNTNGKYQVMIKTWDKSKSKSH